MSLDRAQSLLRKKNKAVFVGALRRRGPLGKLVGAADKKWRRSMIPRALGTLGFSLTVLMVPALSNAQGVVAPTSGPESRITILYDAFGKDASMRKDWGFSALVEIAGKRILFDTGDDRDIFAANVKAKNVDLTKLDFVVLSHRHGDHMAGLAHVLSVNPTVKIYAPKDGFGGIYGSSAPSSFYRKDDSLPPEMRYYDGRPPDVLKLGTAWQDANFELIDKTTEIAPGITLIALVSETPGTKELKELSLAVNTADGLVLVVGCSHPGIDKIVEAAATINPKIHLIVGGFHLVVASDDVISKVVATLKDTFKVEKIAPGHCTGEPTFAALKQVFGDRYIYAGVGTTLVASGAGAAQRRGEAPAFDDDDLAGYRRLAAREDPFGLATWRRRLALTKPAMDRAQLPLKSAVSKTF
jgi:7,8-dihydropterin-6-yl-methyl-4-(beta-D-ribofuranosyl)aminobenzene 5'-phosphate synthase